MNKKLNEGLRTAFEPPPPKRRDGFLLSVNFPKMTQLDFLLAQIGYIRKRVWVAALMATVAMIALCSRATENEKGFIWMVSSLLPFVVLVGITEIARSVSHNMAELEMGCKYSFSDVVLMRLGIIGGTNMLMFVIAMTSLSIMGYVGILRLGIYLFVPFLLTCSLSLFAFNRLRPREGIYICGGISCFVSIMNAFISSQYSNVFSDGNMMFWVVSFLVLLVFLAGEIVKLIQKTEENQWNLSLTA